MMNKMSIKKDDRLSSCPARTRQAGQGPESSPSKQSGGGEDQRVSRHTKPRKQARGRIVEKEAPYACKVHARLPQVRQAHPRRHKCEGGKKSASARSAAPNLREEEQRTMANMPSMKKKYCGGSRSALMTKFQYESVMQIPKIEKIVVSVGCGDARITPRRSTPSSGHHCDHRPACDCDRRQEERRKLQAA